MATILITGGTGLVGTALTHALLERGYEVIILTRELPLSKDNQNEKLTYKKWDIENDFIDENAIKKADHIVHLAGASIADKRWNAKRKKEILDSRVKSSTLLVNTLIEIPNKVKTFISASAIGIYGDDRRFTDAQPFTEEDEANDDFLGETCKQWEKSVDPVSFLDKRLVKLRIGIVLSKDGGALDEFKKPLRFGIAPILGSGKQVMSWIHIDDLVRMIMYALETEAVKGVYNAVAPKPVSNKELMLSLARSIKGKFFVPAYVPSFVLKVIVGEMSTEVLKSATVSSRKIEDAGFIFQYPVIKLALRNLK